MIAKKGYKSTKTVMQIVFSKTVCSLLTRNIGKELLNPGLFFYEL
jgi:hypothetical protein